MEIINELFLNYSSFELYLMMFSLILFTSIGLFPGNTDIFMLSLGSISATGVISPFEVIGVCLIALFIGESMAYFVSHKWGKDLLEKPFFQREKIKNKTMKMKNAISKGSLLTAFTIRAIPALRPVNIALAVVMSEKTRPLYRNHLILLFLYVPLNIMLSNTFAGFIKEML